MNRAQMQTKKISDSLYNIGTKAAEDITFNGSIETI